MAIWRQIGLLCILDSGSMETCYGFLLLGFTLQSLPTTDVLWVEFFPLRDLEKWLYGLANVTIVSTDTVVAMVNGCSFNFGAKLSLG